jgi:hypothetical protein
MVIMWWLYLMYYCIRIQTKTKSVRFCGFTPGLGSERDGFHLVISSVWKRCTTSQGNLWGPRMGLGLLGMPQVSFPWLRADWSCLGIPRTSRQCTFGRIPGFRCSFLISEKVLFNGIADICLLCTWGFDVYRRWCKDSPEIHLGLWSQSPRFHSRAKL